MLTDQRTALKLRRAGFIVATAIVAVHVIIILHRRETHPSDFDISREFGRRFVAGEELYLGGLHFPYMPAAAMFFAPLAMINPTAGFLVRYAIALASLWLALSLLNRMVSRGLPTASARAFAIGAITLILASHYIVRDLDDGGPHLILLAAIVTGLCLMSERREFAGAGLIGFAIAQKATSALFIPFFGWKRNWGFALLTAIATTVWMVLPAVRMGPAGWWHHQREWFWSSASLAMGRFPAAEFYYGSRRVENQSLKAAVAAVPRFLGADSTASGDSRLIQLMSDVATVALLALFCAKTRRRYQSPDDPAFLLEGSAVMIISLLLSPITWVQHLVFALPALYLIVSEQIASRSLGKVSLIAMGAYAALALLLTRDLIGKASYDLVLALHAHTIALLILLGILLFRRPTAALNDA
ncbi:MAG TPA: glycosyltransferase family 87 protein [Candidatus Binataceae bacterium]